MVSRKNWEINTEHFIFVMALALVLRVSLIPYFWRLGLVGDEHYYWAIAKGLAGERLASRMNFWGFVLGIPAAFSHHLGVGRLFGALVGSLACGALYLLTSYLFESKTALVAGILIAVFPEHIAYSHYFWSENFTGLIYLVSLLFFSFYVNEEDHPLPLLALSATILGFGLWTDEFPVLVFAAYFVILFSKKLLRPKTVLILTALFILPVATYAIVASKRTGRTVILADAPMRNFSEAAKIKRKAPSEKPSTMTGLPNILGALFSRGLEGNIRNFSKQISNLWTCNSYPVVRLAHPRQSWGYHRVPFRKFWIFAIIVSFTVIIILGLTGLILSEWSLFKIFSSTILVLLPLTGVVAWLFSRFREPFLFIFIIYTASLIVHHEKLLPKLKDLKKSGPLAVLIVLFLINIAHKLSVGRWTWYR